MGKYKAFTAAVQESKITRTSYEVRVQLIPQESDQRRNSPCPA
jgi:hypothetical protein